MYFCSLKHHTTDMNIFDLILAIPLGFLIWKGFRRGAIFEVTSLVGVAVGIFLGYRLCRQAMGWLGLTGDTALLIAFFVVFVAVVVLAVMLGKLIEGVIKLVKVGFLNNLLGALFGLLKGTCILSVLLFYVTVIDRREVLLTAETKQESLLYRPVTRTGDKLIGGLKTYVVTHRQIEN